MRGVTGSSAEATMGSNREKSSRMDRKRSFIMIFLMMDEKNQKWAIIDSSSKPHQMPFNNFS
jgi:hypothetical protein